MENFLKGYNKPIRFYTLHTRTREPAVQKFPKKNLSYFWDE